MQSLTPLPPVESLSPRVVRVLGQNPGKMTLQGTNTYLIGTGARRMLLDAGEGGIPEYVAHLRAAMTAQGVRSLAAIVLTHHHHDHVGGVPEVLAMLRELAGAAEAPRIFKQKVEHEDAGMEFPFDDICVRKHAFFAY